MFFFLGWLLIILVSCSTILALTAVIGMIFIVKYRFRVRKYKKISGNINKKFVPGKIEAYFQGNYEKSYSIVPKTYPTTVQEFRDPYKGKSCYKTSSMHQGKVSFNKYKHESIQEPFNLSKSLDDRLFRKTFHSPKDAEIKRLGSLPGDGLNLAVTDSRRGSRTSSFNEGYTNSEILLNENSVYSHCEFLEGVHEECVNEPVISYDQEYIPTDKSVGYGSLSFMLQYDASVPELLIRVKRALDLPSVTGDIDKPVNSYVNLCLVPEDFLWKRTQVIENDRDPVFNTTFEIRDVLHHKLREYILCFYVMDKNVLGERVIGKILYPLSDLRAEQIIDVCKELSPP